MAETPDQQLARVLRSFDRRGPSFVIEVEGSPAEQYAWRNVKVALLAVMRPTGKGGRPIEAESIEFARRVDRYWTNGEMTKEAALRRSADEVLAADASRDLKRLEKRFARGFDAMQQQDLRFHIGSVQDAVAFMTRMSADLDAKDDALREKEKSLSDRASQLDAREARQDARETRLRDEQATWILRRAEQRPPNTPRTSEREPHEN